METLVSLRGDLVEDVQREVVVQTVVEVHVLLEPVAHLEEELHAVVRLPHFFLVLELEVDRAVSHDDRKAELLVCTAEPLEVFGLFAQLDGLDVGDFEDFVVLGGGQFGPGELGVVLDEEEATLVGFEDVLPAVLLHDDAFRVAKLSDKRNHCFCRLVFGF